MRISSLGFLLATVPAFAGVIHIDIDTSAVAGSLFRVALDVTTSSPQAFSCFGNCVSVVNFSAPGSTMDTPDTTGGLVTGDLILLNNPAALTYIDKGFAFNNITVNLSPVGNSITFTLDYTEAGPTGGNPPDQIALFLLNDNYLPLFPTLDPLGTDALLAIDLTGDPGGVLNVYSPAVLVETGNVSITVPPSGNGEIPEPGTLCLVTAAAALLGFRLLGREVQTRRKSQ